MRQTAGSGKNWWIIRFSDCAETRSRPKGFSTIDASVFCAARFGQTFCDGCKHTWRYSQIMQWPLSFTKHVTQALIRGLITVIPIDVLKTRNKFSESVALELAVLLDTVASPILQLIQVPTGLSHSDDRPVKVATLNHCL